MVFARYWRGTKLREKLNNPNIDSILLYVQMWVGGSVSVYVYERVGGSTLKLTEKYFTVITNTFFTRSLSGNGILAYVTKSTQKGTDTLSWQKDYFRPNSWLPMWQTWQKWVVRFGECAWCMDEFCTIVTSLVNNTLLQFLQNIRCYILQTLKQ